MVFLILSAANFDLVCMECLVMDEAGAGFVGLNFDSMTRKVRSI